MTIRRPTSRLLAPLPRLLGALGVLVLVGMHLPLLVQRLSDASISQPGVLLRWLLVPVLGAAFATLHRRGYSLVRGRAALVLWLLVLLLHAAPATTADGSHELLLVAPVALGTFGAVLLLATVALVRRARGARPAPKPLARASREFTLPASPALSPPGFAPRPPPLSPATLFV